MDAFVRRITPTTAIEKSLSQALMDAAATYRSSPKAVSPTKAKKLPLPDPIPLTQSNSSWVIHIPQFFPSPSRQAMQRMWESHPPEYHPLMMYGKKLNENRYSQLYSYPDGDTTTEQQQQFYGYSGSSRPCTPCDPSKEKDELVINLCDMAEDLVGQLVERGLVQPQLHASCSRIYNVCLINWYQPDHHIGLHSDEATQNNLSVPIVSLSWGGPRRFLLRAKPKTTDAVEPVKEFLLRDGDLLIMGGRCQQEFKHEVPKVRKKDGLVTNRISWTIRCVELKGGKKSDNSAGGIKRKRES